MKVKCNPCCYYLKHPITDLETSISLCLWSYFWILVSVGSWVWYETAQAKWLAHWHCFVSWVVYVSSVCSSGQQTCLIWSIWTRSSTSLCSGWKTTTSLTSWTSPSLSTRKSLARSACVFVCVRLCACFNINPLLPMLAGDWAGVKVGWLPPPGDREEQEGLYWANGQVEGGERSGATDRGTGQRLLWGTHSCFSSQMVSAP